MHSTLRIVSLVVLLLSIAWVAFKPGFDSAVATVAALAALISTFLVKKDGTKKPTLSQKVSDGSIGIQAGRDVHGNKLER